MKRIIYLIAFCALFFVACRKEAEPIRVSSVSVSQTSAILTEGETLHLIATVSPSNADNPKVIWSTNHPDIAAVNNGVVTAVKEGEATITVTSEDSGASATCSVTVKAKVVNVESVALNEAEISLTVGDSFTLTATVSPDNATDKTVSWSSSDNNVVSVKDGEVTAVSVGSASITARAGDKTATCVVTTTEPDEPFTITSIGDTQVSICKVGSPHDVVLEYRKGSDSWCSYTINSVISLTDGESLQFRAGEKGNISFSQGSRNQHRFKVEGGFIEASGNIMSLLDRSMNNNSLPDWDLSYLFWCCDKLIDASQLKLPATTLAPACYDGMFVGCSSLKRGPVLPATTLADYCYYAMFEACTSLIEAPELPATTLADSCYGKMFLGCSSLTQAPVLPATTLADYCYSCMFQECTSLSEAPELPATTLTDHCYNYMFMGCSSLIRTPELPATNLANSCYESMFDSCTSLSIATSLPAMAMKSLCYYGMFSHCESLVEAPILPSMSLARACYSSMFQNCTSLVDVPELPATDLVESCYSYMFYCCSSLKQAPELPATTLATSCYRDMFCGCTSLKQAPMLPATFLTTNCYTGMFSDCKSLNYVKAMFITKPSFDYTYRWLSNVSHTGTFVKNKNAEWDEKEVDDIPYGWTVITE